MNKVGKLIVIDGLDGSGKATQAQMLVEKLKQQGQLVIKVSFPNYQDDSSILIKKYLSGEFGCSPEDVNPFAASSFYAIDRFVSYKKYWECKYLEGYYVICDRYVTSNLIHQMAKIKRELWADFVDWLEDYEYNRLGLPKPHQVIYLDLDVNVSQKLIGSRCEKNHIRKDIHEDNVDYLRKCKEAAMYVANLQGWNVIECADEHRQICDREFLSSKIFSLLNFNE